MYKIISESYRNRGRGKELMDEEILGEFETLEEAKEELSQIIDGDLFDDNYEKIEEYIKKQSKEEAMDEITSILDEYDEDEDNLYEIFDRLVELGADYNDIYSIELEPGDDIYDFIDVDVISQTMLDNGYVTEEYDEYGITNCTHFSCNFEMPDYTTISLFIFNDVTGEVVTEDEPKTPKEITIKEKLESLFGKDADTYKIQMIELFDKQIEKKSKEKAKKQAIERAKVFNKIENQI